MDKRCVGKSLVVFFVVVIPIVVGTTACGAKPKPNPNAIWLEVPKEVKGWVSYEVKEQDGEYWVFLDLPKEAQLYFAAFSQYFDATTTSIDTFWVSPVENDNLWNARCKDWWDRLSPLAHEFRVDILERKDHQALYLLEQQLGQEDAAFLYVRNGREWLAFWAPPFHLLNTVHRGRLRAAICHGYNTEEVAAWKAQ